MAIAAVHITCQLFLGRDNIRFVKEVDIEIEKTSGNAKEVKRVLDSITSKQMLANYQRELRDE